jgi:hypothetical protein
VLAGNFTLDEAFEAACASGYLACAQREELTAAMGRFAATLRRWRQTHYSLGADARRPAIGTSATKGRRTKSVRTIPVFRSVEHAEGDIDLNRPDVPPVGIVGAGL